MEREVPGIDPNEAPKTVGQTLDQQDLRALYPEDPAAPIYSKLAAEVIEQARAPRRSRSQKRR